MGGVGTMVGKKNRFGYWYGKRQKDAEYPVYRDRDRQKKSGAEWDGINLTADMHITQSTKHIHMSYSRDD